MNSIPLSWVDPEDVSKVVLFLASDEARYTNGAAMKIDLGATA
jgi:(+)-trans-carveol dehydrogenase